MPARDPRESVWRQMRYESFEERLVLSAQPIAGLVVDAFESTQLQAGYGEVAPTLADVNQSSGVDYAHEQFGFTGRNQTVAVIDTGVAYDHTSLGGGFGAGSRVRGGWDFAENDSNPYDDGPSGFHGTHVAGIVGSDHEYHTGVAPEADLVALRVFDDLGNGDMAWVEQALQWVLENRVQHNITTVNLSLGTTWNSDSIPSYAELEDEFQQLDNVGVFISVAAGNSFQDFNSPGLSYPAASPYVVPVASHGSDGTMSDFSQRNDRVLVAPGEQISSAIPSHLYGGSGPSQYFLPVSGTSMAAPYVAGASMIMREAMSFAGHQNISQDAIYDHFRDTADLIYDSVTGENYHRLNLERALDTLLADEYGSTAADAHDLGTLSSSDSFGGTIGRLDDVDFLTFTAAESGTMTLAAGVTHDMISDWQLVGGGGAADGNSLTFDVQAGQSYTVSLASSNGLGHYDVGVSLETAAPVAVDLGTIAAALHDGENISTERAYQFTATRDGIMTVESFFVHAGGNIDMELYDADNQLLASSSSMTDHERLDITASAGDTFTLRVRGTNSDVDLRLTNLVQQSGDTVNVFGTSGNDEFAFTAGADHRMLVNGVSYEFGSAGTKSFVFDGQGGSDRITINGTAGRELAIVNAGAVDFHGRGFMVSAESVETIRINGGGGGDWARMFDSSGDDVLSIRPNAATMAGAGYSNTVDGFDRIYAVGQNGGYDRASALDSAGDDRFESRPESSTMRGQGYYNYMRGFESVSASASSGNDKAWMHDSPGNDTLYSRDHFSSITGAGFHNRAQNFDQVYVYANRGGTDRVDIGPSLVNNEYHVASGSASTAANVENATPDVIVRGADRQDPTVAGSVLPGAAVFGQSWRAAEAALHQERLLAQALGEFDEDSDRDIDGILLEGADHERQELRAIDAIFGDV